MAGEPVISIRGLRTQFGRTVIHDGVDLDVLAGEVMGIVGASGTGKSVLMRAIIGLLTPTAGTISLFGADTAAMSRRNAAMACCFRRVRCFRRSRSHRT